jgi:hypothetical protein
MLDKVPDEMIAVASGTPALVSRWSQELRKAVILYSVRQPVESDGQPNHAEIWVETGDAEEARTALMRVKKRGESLLW